MQILNFKRELGAEPAASYSKRYVGSTSARCVFRGQDVFLLMKVAHFAQHCVSDVKCLGQVRKADGRIYCVKEIDMSAVVPEEEEQAIREVHLPLMTKVNTLHRSEVGVNR